MCGTSCLVLRRTKYMFHLKPARLLDFALQSRAGFQCAQRLKRMMPQTLQRKTDTGLTNVALLYVQVTVHRDNLSINNQQDVSSIQNFILLRNSTCFGHLLCPSSGVIGCTRGNWDVLCRICGRYLAESGWNLTLLGSGHITANS
jgi:hypothetical protein